MIPPASRQRVLRQIPGNEQREPDDYESTVEVEWWHPGEQRWLSVDLDLDVRWRYQDEPLDYPCVVLDLDPAGVQRYSGSSIDDTFERLDVADPEKAYEEIRGTDLYDVLNIITAVEEGRGGIPKDALAKELAREVYETFKFESQTLNSVGVHADGTAFDFEESPPLVVKPMPAGSGGIYNTSAMVDEQPIARYTQQWKIEYTATHSVVYDAVKRLEYVLALDVDADGDIDSEYPGSVDMDLT